MPEPMTEYREVTEFEAREADGTRTLTGYAAMFDKLSVDLGGFREKIGAGAFNDSLTGDVLALWSHNPDIVLGRTKSKTLNISTDEKGLAFELRLGDNAWADYAWDTIKRKDVRGMSFGFVTLEDKWDRDENKTYIRTLLRVDLIEISPTGFPAYPQTKVNARARESVLESGIKSLATPDAPATPAHLSRAMRARRLRIAELG